MEVIQKNKLDSKDNSLTISDEIVLDFELFVSDLDIEKQMTKFTMEKILNHTGIKNCLIE